MQIQDTAADSSCSKKGGSRGGGATPPGHVSTSFGVCSVNWYKTIMLPGKSSVGHHIRASGSKHGRACSDEGTDTKYDEIATLNRLQYCFGEMTVGSLRAPPSMTDDFTQVSSCLSHVYCMASDTCFIILGTMAFSTCIGRKLP